MSDIDNLNIKVRDGITVVTFVTADIGNVLGIERTSELLAQKIQTETPAKLVINFDDVKFFSSQTLGMLLNVWKKVEKYGGKMVIAGINPQLSRLFRITNLDKVFEFYEDVDRALAALI